MHEETATLIGVHMKKINEKAFDKVEQPLKIKTLKIIKVEDH